MMKLEAPTFKVMQKLNASSRALQISILAILIAVASLSYAFATRPSTSASATTREFYLVTPEESFNETVNGIPHYIFSPTTITVNRGDTVIIHFYNVADDTHHTFTLTAYNINVDLAPGQKKDIQFVAGTAGVFGFYCTYHPLEMRGELVVLSV